MRKPLHLELVCEQHTRCMCEQRALRTFPVSGFRVSISWFEFRVSGFGFVFRIRGFIVHGFRFRIFRVSGFGIRVSEFRVSVFSELRVSGFSELRVSGSGVRAQDCLLLVAGGDAPRDRLQVRLGLGSRFGFRFRAPVSGFQVSTSGFGFAFRCPGLRFRSPGFRFRFWVSVSGFQVSGSGFQVVRVPGFGLGLLVSTWVVDTLVSGNTMCSEIVKTDQFPKAPQAGTTHNTTRITFEAEVGPFLQCLSTWVVHTLVSATPAVTAPPRTSVPRRAYRGTSPIRNRHPP